MDGYKRRQAGPSEASVTRLSPREREVLQLVSEGKASKDIAAILNVAVATAETHRCNLLRKLKLHSTAELVLYAVRNGFVHVHFPPSSITNLRAEGIRPRAISGYAEVAPSFGGEAGLCSVASE